MPSPTASQLDRLIAARFTVSLMNDSKWERLIARLADAIPKGVHVCYKLIHSDAILRTTLTRSDFNPFFLEPTLYREIEWIEFPYQYEDYLNPDHKKAGMIAREQDVSAIEREVHSAGKFELEPTATGLRLHAYR